MQNIMVKKIEIERVEGRSEDCKKVELLTWAGAGAVLRDWAQNAPEDGSYDKCDFWIEWKDGEQYKGRFDLQRKHSKEWDHIGRQVNGFLNYLAKNGRTEAIEFLESHSLKD